MQGWQRALFLLGFVKGHISRDEKGILDLWRVGVPRCGQELDSDGLFQLPETLDPLQRGGRAAVLEHGTRHRNVLLHRGYREVTIEDVTTTLSLYSQVVPIVFDSSMAPLLDVNVSSTDRNCDNVTVAIAGRKNKELDLDNVHTLFC